MRIVHLATLLACAACGAPQQQPREPSELRAALPTSDADTAGSLAHLYDARGRPHPTPPSATTAQRTTPDDRWAVQSLGLVSKPQRSRPRRVGKRDIRMRNARLDNALRIIAELGRFNLVMKGSQSDPVTLDLSEVEPYDALLALAEARGMSIRYQGNVVIVSLE
jgi:hypothetical protein